MAFWSSTSWYYFDAWVWSSSGVSPGWKRVYSRGPMQLTSAQAQTEHLDTMEAFMQGMARTFRWSGAHWERVH